MAKIHLYDFEHLNTTTESIYELGNFNLLIVLKDGKNLTNWKDVENREDIIFISEDLFGQTQLEARYKGLKNLRAIVTFGVGNVNASPLRKSHRSHHGTSAMWKTSVSCSMTAKA